MLYIYSDRKLVILIYTVIEICWTMLQIALQCNTFVIWGFAKWIKQNWSDWFVWPLWRHACRFVETRETIIWSMRPTEWRLITYLNSGMHRGILNIILTCFQYFIPICYGRIYVMLSELLYLQLKCLTFYTVLIVPASDLVTAWHNDPWTDVHDPWLGAEKNFKLVWRCHQLLSGFLAKGHLPRVSRQSRWSINNKNHNEMMLGAVHTSPGICLTAEENLSLETVWWRGCATSHRLK